MSELIRCFKNPSLQDGDRNGTGAFDFEVEMLSRIIQGIPRVPGSYRR